MVPLLPGVSTGNTAAAGPMRQVRPVDDPVPAWSQYRAQVSRESGSSMRRLLSAGLVLVLTGAGCGSGRAEVSDSTGPTAGPAPSPPPTATASTAPAPTTMLPPGGRLPTAEKPLRVLLLGNSMLFGVAPALRAGLEQTGSATTAQELFTLSDHPSPTAAARVATDHPLAPEVVVILSDSWEWLVLADAQVPGVDVSRPGWQDAYRTRVIEPWVEQVTDTGMRVVWLAMPVPSDPAAVTRMAALNDVYRAVANANDGVTLVETDPVIAAPDGTYTETVTSSDGRMLRVRALDGLHLCPDGARLIAAEALVPFARDWGLALESGWEDGAWRTEDRSWRGESPYPPQLCPPA